MRSKIVLSIIIMFCTLFSHVGAQDTTAIHNLKKYAQNYISFSKNYPQEKVYLHLDNSSYFLGETIWFKAYVTRADRNSLSNLSKVLYVELINPEGYILETKKIKIENGQCSGSFNLAVTNYAGFFEIRAYTRYMLNFSDQNYFTRVLPVYNVPENEGDYKTIITERPNSQRIPVKRPDSNEKRSLSINFYPEGGSLVNGLNTRVAFKALGNKGENAIISGFIFDGKNEKITEINTEYLGMGTFFLQPDSGKYRAKVRYNNTDYTFDLPETKSAGYVMNVNNTDTANVKIIIQKSAMLKSEPLGLSISCRGFLYVFEKINFESENALSLNLSKNLLPSGVSQITLFDSKGGVLSERLIFINHRSVMKMNLSTDKTNYQPFEKVNMHIELSDRHNNPVQTNFSVAVKDAGTCPVNPYSDNLMTNLLLTSELRGYIENPGFYFESEDKSRRQALELLMLTQGWRRYEWKEMAGVKPFNPIHPLEKELAIEGTVVSAFSKAKLKNVEVMMVLLTDSSSQRGKALTDKDGNFGFSLLDYYGNASVIIQSKLNDKRKETGIRLNRNFSPPLKPYLSAELNVPAYIRDTNTDSNEEDTILNSPYDELDSINKKLSMADRIHVLDEVVVTEKRRPVKVSVKYDVAQEMDRIKDTGDWEPSDIEHFLDKINKYFSYITDSSGQSKFSYKGKSVYFLRDDSPDMVAADIGSILSGGSMDLVASEAAAEASASEPTTIKTSETNPSEPNVQMPRFDEIESINIVEDYGSIMKLFSGNPDYDPTKIAIVVMHIKKNYQNEPIGIRNTTFSGFSYPREFYNPQYGQGIMPDKKDFRRTIYWNPDVLTDAEGKATINFFNNSTCRKMNVSAETVTENGIIGVLNK